MIDNTLKKLVKSFNIISNVYESTGILSLKEKFERFAKSIKETSKLCIEYSDVIKPNIDAFLKPYMREIESLNEVINELNSLYEKYVTESLKLKDRKEALFKQKTVDCWNLDKKCAYTLKTLFSNKMIAFSEMLPKETREVINQREKCAYYIGTLLDEYSRMSQESVIRLNFNFSRIAKEQCEIFNMVLFI